MLFSTTLVFATLCVQASTNRLPCEVSWIGNSYPGAKFHVPQDIDAMTVTPDGTVFSNVHWEEGGGNVTAFKDGKVLMKAGHTHGWGNQGGYAVAANAKYVFISGVMNNEGGGLKDPDTWPPKGSDWLGVSRRTLADVRLAATFPHGKGGKGGTLKQAFLVVDEVPVSKGASDDSLRNIAGLCATDARLYVSCPYDSTIKVFDPETMLPLTVWNVERPGSIAVDQGGTLWVLQPEKGALAPKVIRLDANGRVLPQEITFPKGSVPRGISIAPNGNLLVADSGPDQQIRIFGNIDRKPRQMSTLGVRGGIFSGTTGQFGDLRFNDPVAVGSDTNGNIYVASHGCSGGGSTVLESYAPNKKLNWRLFGLEFVDMADWDPASEADVFTKEEHFRMDYKQPAGQQWTYQGYTINRFKYPQDPRLHLWSAGVWIRRIQGQRIQFVLDMNSERMQVYRFNSKTDGETAIPSGLFTGNRIKETGEWPAQQPEKGEWIWRDRNGNGAFDPGEYDTRGGSNAPTHQGWWVDTRGDVWQAGETGGIRKFPFQGFDSSGNPIWDYASMSTVPNPPEFKAVKRLRYDPALDVMYLGGVTAQDVNQHWKPMGPVICCYDNWSKRDRKLRWQVVAPYAKGSQGHESCEPMGFDVAGDYLFLPYTGASKAIGFTTGHIEILKASDGSRVGCQEPSAEVGEIGLQDVRDCLRAYRRPNGEYLLFLEEDYKAKILLYRWTPEKAAKD